METWQINLSLIPTIAVILTSSNRLALGLTDEINVRLSINIEAFKGILPLKIKQLKRISVSIFLMYSSLSVLILNALLTAMNIVSPAYDKILILFAIGIFFIGVYFSLIFSLNAYFIRQKQFSYFQNQHVQ
jgi:hypothetical protein